VSAQHHINGEEMKSVISTEVANPISHNLLGVPFQTIFNFPTGDNNRLQSLLIIEPAIPLSFTEKVYVVTRIIIPLIIQPDDAPSGSTFGISNTNVNIFFCPPLIGNLALGAGPALIIPTASVPETGGDAFGIGPAFTAIWIKGKWITGAILNQIWSYRTSDINLFACQYFITHNFKKG
jgi:hypothetical protein